MANTYYKMYGLNFTEVTPYEYNSLQDIKENTLYIVAPQNYNNYNPEGYKVKLYLGASELGTLSGLVEDTNIGVLEPGIYEVRSNSGERLLYTDTSSTSKFIRFNNLSYNLDTDVVDKSYIIIGPRTQDTNDFYFTIFGDVTLQDGDTQIDYVGTISGKIEATTNNGIVSYNLDTSSVKSIYNSEQIKNKVTNITMQSNSDEQYPTVSAVINLIKSLDVSATKFEPSETAGQISETDGKISVSKQSIQISKSQVTNLEKDLSDIIEDIGSVADSINNINNNINNIESSYIPASTDNIIAGGGIGISINGNAITISNTAMYPGAAAGYVELTKNVDYILEFYNGFCSHVDGSTDYLDATQSDLSIKILPIIEDSSDGSKKFTQCYISVLGSKIEADRTLYFANTNFGQNHFRLRHAYPFNTSRDYTTNTNWDCLVHSKLFAIKFINNNFTLSNGLKIDLTALNTPRSGSNVKYQDNGSDFIDIWNIQGISRGAWPVQSAMSRPNWEYDFYNYIPTSSGDRACDSSDLDEYSVLASSASIADGFNQQLSVLAATESKADTDLFAYSLNIRFNGLFYNINSTVK